MGNRPTLPANMTDRWTLRAWVYTCIGALAVALVVAFRNYYSYRVAGRPMDLWYVVAIEVPIWLAWAACMPIIVRLAVKFPPAGRHVWRNMGLHTVAGLVVVAIIITLSFTSRLLIDGVLPWAVPGGFLATLGPLYLATSIAFLFMYFAMVGLTLMWVYHEEQKEQRTRASELETTLARTQMDLLRMQIHPHFLFNTMHAISALMSTDVNAARKMMIRLSDLLRQSLEDDVRQEVPLREELAFLDSYLDIQLVRFGDRITLRRKVDSTALDLLVPRMMLQPVLENSFVHGVGPREAKGTIWLEAIRHPAFLEITVSDDGAGLHAAPRESGNGTGLVNTATRIRHLYGEKAALVLREREGGGTTTTIRLPVRNAESHDGVQG